MTDLVGGHYPQAFSQQAVPWGGATNVAQANVPPRSNLEYLGYSTMTDGAISSTGVSFAVPVPVDIGTTITTVEIFTGNTAASSPTAQWAALYSGIAGASSPTLIAQTTDKTTTAITALTALKFTFATPQNITAAMAPNGWVYAAVCITSATQPTAQAVAVPANCQYAFYTGSPTFLSCTTGSAQAATASATFAGTAKVVAPIVVLR